MSGKCADHWRFVVSEFDADGTLIFEGRLASNVLSYRAFRSNRTGRPLEAPIVAASDSFGNVVADMNWNGATELVSGQVPMGKGSGAMRPDGIAAKDSFETTVTVQRLGTHLVAVARDALGWSLQSRRRSRSERASELL